jgi:hypothetical protein
MRTVSASTRGKCDNCRRREGTEAKSVTMLGRPELPTVVMGPTIESPVRAPVAIVVDRFPQVITAIGLVGLVGLLRGVPVACKVRVAQAREHFVPDDCDVGRETDIHFPRSCSLAQTIASAATSG